MKLTPTLGGSYSGSLGGLTASHNAGGAYLRRRSTPTNPNTLRQQQVRSITGGLGNSWTNDLSEAQRQGWRDYAAAMPYTDAIGQVITMSGINAFIKANVVAMQWAAIIGGTVADSRVDDAPVVFNSAPGAVSVPAFSGVFTTPPGTFSATVTLGEPMPTGGFCYLFVAPPQTAGTRFYKGPYQLAARVAFVATDTEVSFIGVALASPTWVSSTIPVAGWDALLVPLRVVNVLTDRRVSETWMGLSLFTDATP